MLSLTIRWNTDWKHSTVVFIWIFRWANADFVEGGPVFPGPPPRKNRAPIQKISQSSRETWPSQNFRGEGPGFWGPPDFVEEGVRFFLGPPPNEIRGSPKNWAPSVFDCAKSTTLVWFPKKVLKNWHFFWFSHHTIWFFGRFSKIEIFLKKTCFDSFTALEWTFCEKTCFLKVSALEWAF